MKEITTRNGTQVQVSAEDYERVSKFSWSQFKNGRVYRKVLIPREERIGNKAYRAVMLHREIMGVDDPRKVIFRDGDPTNCTRENLVVKGPTFRPRQRTRKGGSSQYRGVGWNKVKGMWQAYLRVNGKLKHLGFFEPGEEGERRAALVYDDAARKIFGEFAILNFTRQKKRRRRLDVEKTSKVLQSPSTRPADPAPAAPIPAAQPAPAPAQSGAGTYSTEELLKKPFHELTPEEMRWLKARIFADDGSSPGGRTGNKASDRLARV